MFHVKKGEQPKCLWILRTLTVILREYICVTITCCDSLELWYVTGYGSVIIFSLF